MKFNILENKIFIALLLYVSCFNPEPPLDGVVQTISTNESGTSGNNYPTTQIVEITSSSEFSSTSESSNALSITSSTSTEVSTSENETSVISDLPNIMDIGSSTTETGLESSSNDSMTPTTDVIVCGDGILDISEECDDGNRLDTDDCSIECHKPKLIFLSDDYIGKPDFGGIEIADQFCQDEAIQWNISGTFKAWLSDDNPIKDPLIRFDNTGFKGWYKLLSGLPIAKEWTGLQGPLLNPINITATGNKDLITTKVWTNTKPDGKRKLNTSSCANWMSLDDNAVGSGNPQFTTDNWTDAGTTNCNGNTGPGKIYCFQID